MLRICGFTAVVLLASSTALAQSDYARTGPYAGLAGTLGVENFNSGGADFDPSLGLNVLAGYRFDPRIAGELQFEWTSAFEGSNNPGQVEGRLFTANGRVYLFTGQLQPSLFAGIGFLNAELTAPGVSTDGTGFAARLGAGMDFYVTEHFALAFDASYILAATGDVDGLDYGSFGWGFRYRF